MYSAEPLPHFVDEYLAYLHEVHPTERHVRRHPRRTTTFSRISAVRRSTRRYGTWAASPGGSPRSIPARLTDTERLERPALESNIRSRLFELEQVRTWERNPKHYSDIIATSIASQALFDYAPLSERARRVVSKLRQVPRLVQAARDNIRDAPGHLRQGRPRKHARHAAVHRRGPAARVFPARRPAHPRRPRRRLDRGERPRSAATSSISSTTSRRGARAPSASGANDSKRSCGSTKGSPLAPDRLLAIATRELHGVQEEFRRVAGRLNGGDPLAAWERAKADHPPAGQLVHTAQQQLGELVEFIERERIVTIPPGAPVDVAPTPRFYRWTFASMWTPGPFEARPLRATYYITDVDPAWTRRPSDGAPSRLQLRRAVGDLDPRGVPRALPPLSASAPGGFEAAQVDPVLVDRAGRRLGALLRADDAGRRVQAERAGRAARAARRSAHPPVPLHRRHPAALRRSVGRAGSAVLPRGGVSRRRQRPARGGARHVRPVVHPLYRREADDPEAARGLQGQGRVAVFAARLP